MFLDEGRVGGSIAKGRVLQDIDEKSLVMRNTEQTRVFDGALQASASFLAVLPPGDDLGEHGVVKRTDLAAAQQSMIYAHALILRALPMQDGTGLRQKTLGGILGIEAHFDGVSAQFDLILAQG